MGVEYNDFVKLREKLQKMNDIDAERFMISATSEVAGRLLKEVKQRTPVGHKPKVRKEILQMYWDGYQGGTLRRSWTVEDAKKIGMGTIGVYEAKVINPLKIASYVENGHRQRPGRYVPALGKRLTAAWVKGKFFLKSSEDFVRSKVPQIVKKRLDEYLKQMYEE